jgi:hypothetical protein
MKNFIDHFIVMAVSLSMLTSTSFLYAQSSDSINTETYSFSPVKNQKLDRRIDQVRPNTQLGLKLLKRQLQKHYEANPLHRLDKASSTFVNKSYYFEYIIYGLKRGFQYSQYFLGKSMESFFNSKLYNKLSQLSEPMRLKFMQENKMDPSKLPRLRDKVRSGYFLNGELRAYSLDEIKERKRGSVFPAPVVLQSEVLGETLISEYDKSSKTIKIVNEIEIKGRKDRQIVLNVGTEALEKASIQFRETVFNQKYTQEQKDKASAELYQRIAEMNQVLDKTMYGNLDYELWPKEQRFLEKGLYLYIVLNLAIVTVQSFMGIPPGLSFTALMLGAVGFLGMHASVKNAEDHMKQRRILMERTTMVAAMSLGGIKNSNQVNRAMTFLERAILKAHSDGEISTEKELEKAMAAKKQHMRRVWNKIKTGVGKIKCSKAMRKLNL